MGLKIPMFKKLKARHLIAFLILTAVIYYDSYSIAINSAPYGAGVRHVRSDSSVLSSFGAIQHESLDVWSGYSIGSSSANYSLKIVGSRKVGLVKLTLRKSTNGWDVISMELSP